MKTQFNNSPDISKDVNSAFIIKKIIKSGAKFSQDELIKLQELDNTELTENHLETIFQIFKSTFQNIDNSKNTITKKYIDTNLLHINLITEILEIISNNASINNPVFIQDFFKLLKERQDFLKIALDKVNENPKKNKTGLIKSSLHYQLLKQGKNPIKQQSIFDEMANEYNTDMTKISIHKIGLDLGANHTQAIHAIQRLLNATNYMGNINPATNYIGERSPYFGIVDYLPSIRFTPSEFLEAYGLKKNRTNQYNQRERELALNALKELNTIPFAIYYQRINPDNKNKVDLIKQVRPLISITEGYKAIDSELAARIESGEDSTKRITHVAIAPHPILIDQIDSYFVWKPADCYTEIKLLAGTTNKFTFNFVDYLITEYGQRNRKKDGITNTEIRINFNALAYKLNMHSFINKRQWSRIKNTLLSCYEIAKRAGYLTDYKTEQEGKNDTVEVLYLNPEKFEKKAIIQREKELQNSKIEL